jgi:hypothetical protein
MLRSTGQRDIRKTSGKRASALWEKNKPNQAQWLPSIIPETWEVEVEVSKKAKSLQDPISKKKKKKNNKASQACPSVTPATQQAEVG